MRVLTLYTLCLLCLSMLMNSLQAQQKFDPGEIYTLEGDTIQGYLKPLTDEEQSLFITYASVNDPQSADIKTYQADALQGYRLHNGSVYHSLWVESFTLPEAEQRKNSAARQRRFLNLLRTGPVNLYRYHDLTGGVLMLNREQTPEADALYQVQVKRDPDEPQSEDWHRDTLFELKLLLVGGRQFYVEKTYIERLSQYFADCPSLEVPMDLPFSFESITALINDYALCKTGTKSRRTRLVSDWRLSVMGGVEFYLKENYQPNPTPTFGIEVGNSTLSNNFTLSLMYSRVKQQKLDNRGEVQVDLFTLRPNYYFVVNRVLNPYAYLAATYKNGTEENDALNPTQSLNANGMTFYGGAGLQFALKKLSLRVEADKIQSFGKQITGDKGSWRLRLQLGYQL